eukprot:TRINITY_DN36585_c0_g1_i1.p1 TRINITY_DN36585_c0_g1~~TRINITY_DN36585_c0_g1_i1.p1  ORF type:complete len:1063 (+),score=143.49 TRINITY_DN36585_c0_g1_i1:56-3244(+)
MNSSRVVPFLVLGEYIVSSGDDAKGGGNEVNHLRRLGGDWHRSGHFAELKEAPFDEDRGGDGRHHQSPTQRLSSQLLSGTQGASLFRISGIAGKGHKTATGRAHHAIASQGWWPWSQDEPWKQSTQGPLECGVSYFAPGRFRCPSACPFQFPELNSSCHWSCVNKEDCSKSDHRASVADEEIMMCRRCKTFGCDICKPATETCDKCLYGYDLVEGQCLGKMRHVWNCVFVMVGMIVIVVLLWYVSLFFRQTGNKDILSKALIHAERASLLQTEDDTWYPLNSNLRSIPQDGRPPIGGPGLMLFFNFQYSILVFLTVCVVAWTVLGVCTNPDLFLVGTYVSQDPQVTCQAVRWGTAIREELKNEKLIFTVILYIVSTVGVIIYGAVQHKKFSEVDAKTATMMDYALLCKGFPQESGRAVEADIQTFLERSTGVNLVGVSVCWEYSAQKDKVDELCGRDVRLMEERLESDWEQMDKRTDLQSESAIELAVFPPSRNSTTSVPVQEVMESGNGQDGGNTQGRAWDASDMGTLRTMCFRTCWRVCTLVSCAACCCTPCFRALDTMLGGGDDEEESKENQEKGEAGSMIGDREQVARWLDGMKSSGSAVAIFHSESDRDAAMYKLQEKIASRYKDAHVIHPQKKLIEPESMIWSTFTFKKKNITLRIFVGVIFIILSIVVWGAVFYGPLAYYQASVFSVQGTSPPFLSQFLLSMLVTVGNQIIYLLCGLVAEGTGFHNMDDQQALYVALYTGAILVNMVLDVGIVVVSSYFEMMTKGVRTAEGILLSDLPDYTALFESQPMMKVFGEALFNYSFPACFLTPFIVECGLVCGFLPHLMKKIVGSRRSISLQNAEMLLGPVPMDLGRYGDIIINVTLTAASFMTSSGWVLLTMVGLLVSNIYVYAYDQWRVLRCTEAFYFASFDIEDVAQQMLSLPCAVIAATVAFQAYSFDLPVLKTASVFSVMGAAFVVHLILHIIAIALLVPRLGHYEDKAPIQTSYEKAAAHFPGTWFSSNPVHCLRSAYLHKHELPCTYYVKGKERLLTTNPQLGVYYSFKWKQSQDPCCHVAS